MSEYKKQILDRLIDDGWEQLEVDSDIDWWDDEHWRMASRRESYGHEIYICFIVDPHWEGNRKKGQGIGNVMATKTLPQSRNDDANEIASLCMSKRNFETKLLEFMEAIRKYKSSLQ